MRAPELTSIQIVQVLAFVGFLAAFGALLLRPSSGPAISEEENRGLAPAPTLTWSGLADGSYTDALEAFVADHFPGRERWLALHFWLKERRGLRDEAVAVYDLAGFEGGLEDADLEALPEDFAAGEDFGPATDEVVLASGLAAPPDAEEEELGPPEEEAEEEGEPPLIGPRKRVQGSVSRGILVTEGRAMQLFHGGPGGSPSYARAINAYAEALAGEARVFVLLVPTAQTFYLPEDFARRSKSELPNIRATAAMFRPEVKAIDLYEALRGHTDEAIFFRSDHHWTGLGAYYAYAAYCRAAGFEPKPLADMERRTGKAFYGSLYRFTRDPTLAESPDPLEYWVPPAKVSVTRYGAAAPNVGVPGQLFFERGSGYGVFLGGDYPLMVVKNEAAPKRRALLVKNSYGNAFAVYLASHYEKVIIVDYRRYQGSVLDLVRAHEVDDVMILNGTITANATYHVARIAWVLEGKRPT